MQRKDYFFLAALPPATENLEILHKVSGLAEPLLDLRYGSAGYRRSITRKAIQQGLFGITVIADSRDISLISFTLDSLPAGSRIILSSVNQHGADIEALIKQCKRRDIITGVEVDKIKHAKAAVSAGVDFLVASGNEAYGAVSEKTSLILIQELLDGVDIPLVIRGSLGPQGAAGALVAGCSGCILDSQLLLLNDSPLNDEFKECLRDTSPSDTTIIGSLVGCQYRFLYKGSRDEYSRLADEEKNILLQDIPIEEKVGAFEKAFSALMAEGFAQDAKILPVGQGIVFSQQFAEKGLGVKGVLKVYHSVLEDSLVRIKAEFPFFPGSSLAQYHKVKYPIVQGAMACVTDNPNLAVEVSKAGALPFISMVGLSSRESRQLLSDTRLALGSRSFGVGIVNFASPDKIKEQIDILLTNPPDFITIAGGDSGLARRFEQEGIGVYTHAPTPAHLKNLLDDKISGIILEGRESGGHIGALGSLVLWELAVVEILGRKAEPDFRVRLLLAGGIASSRAALAAAVLVSPLLEQEVSVGLQLGTAYLMTDEAVQSGAIPVKYQEMLLRADETAVTGRTVNLPTRWLITPSLLKMLEFELKLEKQDLSLPERKAQMEQLNINNLRQSLSGRQDKVKDSVKRTVLDEDVYMCGQVVSLQSQPCRISELHEELTQKARQLAESCPISETAWEIPEDAVAIIGMGCIFPDAKNPEEYWKNIINLRSAIRKIPKDIWDPDLYYNPVRMPYKTYSKIGAYIDSFEKNPLKFRIPPVSAPFIERNQFLLLEVVSQALEDAGYLKKEFPRDRTAVFVGLSDTLGNKLARGHILHSEWDQFRRSLESVKEFSELSEDLKDAILDKAGNIFNENLPKLSEDSLGGTLNSIVAGRVANCFNLGGTSLAVDCACASSLAAVDLGVKGLQERKFDLAIAGAVDDNLSAIQYIMFSSMGALSAKGSFPFDERADGLVLGEGAGAILLKRLDDAMRDGDKIYGVIRSVETSSDGRVKGITAPDVNGQIRAFERAYDKVLFTPESLSLIEAHGSSTWEGDITEITALTRFVRKYTAKKKFIGIGSVKSMIGHLKSAAGIAGIIKVVLALQNEVLPPTINCEQPRKEIDWENSPFYLITEPLPWKRGLLPRRAAVDAFGFGGINFHAIIEEAPPKEALLPEVCGDAKEDIEFPARIFIFRAPSRTQLIDSIKKTKDELARAGQSSLQKLALGLQETLSLTGQTLTVVANRADELILHLEKAIRVLSDATHLEFSSAEGIYYSQAPLKPEEKVAFLCPGFGPQYLNMGGDLPYYFPSVGEIFSKVDHISYQLLGSSILPILRPEKNISKEDKLALTDILNRPDYVPTGIMALGMGILEVLERVGIRPDMVAGHSVGEYLALYIAGVFDRETAVRVSATRGKITTKHTLRNGAMATINAPAEGLQDMLKEAPGLVVIAGKNCPAQTVISGYAQAVEYAIERLSKSGIVCERLPSKVALHTPLLANCIKPFRNFLEGTTINPPRMPVYSNLTGRAYKADVHFALYLRDILPEHLARPVEFIDNVLSLYEDGARLFVEVGPGSTLSSFVDNILVDKPHWTVVTNLQNRSATLQLLHVLAFCIARGLPVDLNGITQKRKRQALRNRHATVAVKASTSVIARESKPPDTHDLINETLVDQDAKIVRKYLEHRGNFLKDMLRLDFQHFSGKKAAPAEEKVSLVDDLEKRIVSLISRKTGYPPDLIDIDLDVEAELGLDSIKQVEIMREVAQELDINFADGLKSQRFKITTPRKLIEACRGLIAQRPIKKLGEPGKQFPQVDEAKKDWRTECSRWVSEKVETPLPTENNPGLLRGKQVLILSDEGGGIGGLLKGRLEKAGAIVSLISPLKPLGGLPEDYSLILDLWTYSKDEALELGKIDEWWSKVSSRAEAILSVTKKVACFLQKNANNKAFWIEITSLGGELGAGTIKCVPARAGIGLGIIRCLAREFPDKLESLYLDFDSRQSQAFVAECIFNELTHKWTHPEVGYAEGKRFGIYWKVDGLSDQKGAAFPLNSGSVVLAIGGARGITASICRKLAERSHAQFVIVGRAPVSLDASILLSEPASFEAARSTLLEQALARGERIVPVELERLAWQQAWKTERSWNIDKLRSVAGGVTYFQCDITDAVSVRRLIQEVWQKHGRIDLVIQGASDLIEKSILDIGAEEFIKNMKSKALGTVCLLTALSEFKTGTFINLSSVAGRWGNMGQASYAAGHEVAAILVAGMREKYPGRWMNIFFGPWLNVGMIRIGEVVERFRSRGDDFITNETGNDFFIKEFAGGSSRSVAFCGNLPLNTSRMPAQTTAARRPLPPLIDRIDVITPAMVQGRRVFDLKRDHFVADHYIEYDSPIVPGVVSLGMINQVASLLNSPELSVTDIEDVIFPHPGIFPRGEPREFYARAKMLSKDENGAWFFGEMFSLFTPLGSIRPQEICHASCKLRFGQRRPPQKPSLLLVSSGIGDCRVDLKPLWETKERRFRIGMFRNIHSFSSVTRDGVSGEILVPYGRQFNKCPWLEKFLRLDGLLDSISLSALVFLDNRTHFIKGIKSIKFFASDDFEESRYCRSRIRKVTEEDLIYDVESMDSKGNVVERLIGVKKAMAAPDRVLDLSEPIWDSMRENPRQKEIKSLLACQGKLALTQIDISLVEGALEADENQLLVEQLTQEEIKPYHSLSHLKRRLEWLAGRIVAKGAVRMYLDKQAPLANAITVKSLPNHFPYITLDTKGNLASLPHISISHCNNIAVAVAADSPGIGIDAEEISESILEISDDFCTDEELGRIMAYPRFTKLTALTNIWAIKEASLKAVGEAAYSMKEVILKKVKPHGKYISCELSCSSISNIRSVAFQSNGYIFAVSLSLKKRRKYRQGND